MAESKSEGKYDEEAKGGEAKGGEAKGGDFVAVKVQNSDKIVLFEGEIDKATTLAQIVEKYMPTPPDGHQWSLFEVTTLYLFCHPLAFASLSVASPSPRARLPFGCLLPITRAWSSPQ